MSMIRLLVADDHHILRAGLRTVLQAVDDIQVVAEATDGNDAVAKAASTACDAMILDINMPHCDGFQALAQIRRIKPELPVLMVSQLPGRQYALRAFKNGANGYLMKDCEPAQLIEAIRRVASGNKYMSPDVAEQLLHQMVDLAGELPHLRLSERETQIFELLVNGTALTDISDMLCISSKTVTTHRGKILEKMGLQNNAELVKYAMRHGLIRE